LGDDKKGEKRSSIEELTIANKKLPKNAQQRIKHCQSEFTVQWNVVRKKPPDVSEL